MSTNSTSESRELVETPDLNGAYPRLDEAGIAALAPLGRRRRVQPEEVLFREGDRECQFFVVLAGKVASVEGHGTPEERVISVHGHGRFLGRELVARDQGIGDLILRAYLIRRSILIGLGAGLRIIGSRYSPDARRVRDFTARNRLPYRWLDRDGDPGAEALLAQFGVAPQDTPIVILHARVLRNPSNAELAAAAGLPAPSSSPARCDLLVGRVRSGRDVRRRLRRLGRPAHHGAGRHGHRRPGRHLSPDRELPRLPVRHIRGRARRTGHAPGP
jgi:thioredoxin reductase (NADPH)